MNTIPKDPIMLLSYVNLKLRDYYADLESMCRDLDLDAKQLCRDLEAVDYHYDRERNQFV